MNSTFKSNYLHLPIILLLLLTIFSCEKENLEDLKGQNQNTQSINFTVHSTEHLVQNDNNLKQALQLLNTKRQKATASSVYNFGIYESSVQVLEATNYTQYTFEMYRPTAITNQLENYVLKIYDDDSNEQFIVTYDLNPDYSYNFNNIEAINDPSLITTKSFGCYIEFVDSFDITECSPIYCSIDGHEDGGNGCLNNPEDGGQPNPDLGLNCETTTVFVFADECNGGATDSTPNPSDPQEPTSTNGSGNTTTNNPNNSSEPEEETTITNPYTKVSQCTKDAINNLSQDMADWINSLDNCVFGGTTCNQQLYDDITGFVDDNKEGCELNSEAGDFLNAVKDTIEEDPDAEVDWENQYIFEINETIEFQNHPCVKSIKDDLKNSSKISEIIKKFEPTFPILHLEWGMFTNSNFGNTGQTILNEDINTAFININTESFAHVSPIVIANTIAHELIHAELYRKLKELVDDVNLISMAEYDALADNFPGIKDYVFRYGNIQSTSNGFNVMTWSLTPNFSQAHHNQMADFYRNTLIDAMKAYDNMNGINRGSNSDTFYEAISWAGLRSYNENGQILFYDAWQNFVDLIDQQESNILPSQRTYNVYKNIINQEYNNPSPQCQ